MERHEPRCAALAFGPDPVAESLGMHGIVSSGLRNEDEGLYPVQHGYWLETLRRAVTSNPTEH